MPVFNAKNVTQTIIHTHDYITNNISIRDASSTSACVPAREREKGRKKRREKRCMHFWRTKKKKKKKERNQHRVSFNCIHTHIYRHAYICIHGIFNFSNRLAITRLNTHEKKKCTRKKKKNRRTRKQFVSKRCIHRTHLSTRIHSYL